MRERSAERRCNNEAPCEAPACLCDQARAPPGAPLRRFFTRPPHFLAWTGGSYPLTLSGRHLRRRSSRPVQPFKADPSSGSGSDRASRSVVTSHGCGRRTLLRQLDVPRRRPQLSKAWRVYRDGKRKEGKLELRCEFSGERGIREIVQLS